MSEIHENNKMIEERLNNIYMKHCTKFCPNPKCGVRIAKVQSGCTHVQCTQCHQYFCWACNNPAKGQKHYKEKPQCLDEASTLLPLEVTAEMVEKYMGMSEDPYIDVRTVVKCPHCGEINRKKGTANMLTCEKCAKVFCYICNKPVEGTDHYGSKAPCREHSQHYQDF